MTYCGRGGYPHPEHDECAGYDEAAMEELAAGWRPADGMTDEARGWLRVQREG